MKEKHLFGVPNAFGGQDLIDETGATVLRSEASAWGGTVYTKPDGSFAGFGTKDFSGGETITGADGSLAGFSTRDFGFGSDFFLNDDSDN